MAIDFESYESIKKWKETHISESLSDTLSLNEFHDKAMNKVFELAVIRLNKGKPPCDYCWFVTGSGGRFEQGLISDQDHGIVFDIFTNENAVYFLELGKEISYGLDIVGYPYCKGNIMSSNPLWCKSVDDWKEQLFKWMEERSWESIRNLQIFFDARCLNGTNGYVHELKSFICEYQKKHSFLLKRFMESVMHIKNAVSPLGQIIVEDHGEHQGSIDLKYSAFIPYVNAIRMLAIKEGISETSTLDRMDRLSLIKEYGEELRTAQTNFQTLLGYRLSLSQVHSYEDTHFLKINNLNKLERKEIKRILKDGKRLHYYVRRLIEKG